MPIKRNLAGKSNPFYYMTHAQRKKACEKAAIALRIKKERAIESAMEEFLDYPLLIGKTRTEQLIKKLTNKSKNKLKDHRVDY